MPLAVSKDLGRTKAPTVHCIEYLDPSGRAAKQASRDAGATCWEYLVWAWHWADPESDDIPWSRCRRLGLAARQRAGKRAALIEFKTQIRPLGDAAEDRAVLPGRMLARFCRPWEVYVL